MNGIDCPSDVDLSCTVKLDDDMLVSITVVRVVCACMHACVVIQIAKVQLKQVAR